MNPVTRQTIEDLTRIAKSNGLTFVAIETGDMEIEFSLSCKQTPAVNSVKRAVVESTFETQVKSTMVGYFRPSPSFVEGARVSVGETIGVVEALGLPNELQAHESGIVRQILVGDGEPVQYGQVLAKLVKQ